MLKWEELNFVISPFQWHPRIENTQNVVDGAHINTCDLFSFKKSKQKTNIYDLWNISF